MKTQNPFAEVIESSLHSFLAQSWQWDTFPAFGSLVSIPATKRTLIGLVHQIQTGSMDPVRYPFAYQKSEEELRAEQPQIFEFLKTSFTCLVVGYQEKGDIFYMLPPEPPKIHAFVQPMPTDLAKTFFHNQRYLHVLFGLSNQIINMDELLLAILRQQSEMKILSPDKISSFMSAYSLLTGNDYRRLKLFLQRAQPLITD